jgi:tetratricopeptide (TPR) repeat protein
VKTTAIYCQSCRAANDSSETHCEKCGARLLLIVFPHSLQYDTNHPPTYYEDHLLERVTLLELRLAQLSERLESAYDFLQRGLDAFQKDRLLLQSFLETIKLLDPEFARVLTEKSQEKYGELRNKQSAAGKRKRILDQIKKHHQNPNAELFTHLIEEGVRLLTEGEEKQAFQMLERAALLSPNNVPLYLLIAENLFRVDKYAEAAVYLEKIFEFATTNPKLLVLLGAISADFAQTEKARKLLSVLAGSEKYSPVVNYIWGMLAAYEGNWSEAVVAFKQATIKKESAEVFYLIGCAFYELKRESEASNFLQKAISADPGFQDAFLMQSLIYKLQSGEFEEKNGSAAIFEQNEGSAQSLELLQERKLKKTSTALPFAHFKKENARILTGGSLRLTKYIREMILQAIE